MKPGNLFIQGAKSGGNGPNTPGNSEEQKMMGIRY